MGRDRVVALEEYHRSLENLTRGHVFNAETHKPWNEQDAAARWDFAQKQAAKDQANCQLAASLPALKSSSMSWKSRQFPDEKLPALRPAKFGGLGLSFNICRGTLGSLAMLAA